ncbi:MAG: InlB B-repeat-containing protein [Bacteroidales bacterium]|nr:InlB B-repeat-containing protein [Bacteroidales bacterium]
MKKDGYKFLGWSLTENGEIITEYTVTEKEVTLFAVWVQTFTVKFETDGGTGEFASQTIEKGKTATKPETKPEKENYVFMGWYDGNTKLPVTTAPIGRLRLTTPRARTACTSTRSAQIGAAASVATGSRFGWCGFCRTKHIPNKKITIFSIDSEIVRNNGFAVFSYKKIYHKKIILQYYNP